MKRVVGFVIVFFIIFVCMNNLAYVSAQPGSSGERVDILNTGCTQGSLRMNVASCSRDDGYYCDMDARLWNMKNPSESEKCADWNCCPNNYRCIEDPSDSQNTVRCVEVGANCGIYEDESTCAENSCLWFSNRDPSCQGLAGVGCYDYSSDNYGEDAESACTEDQYGLSTEGMDTEICGTSVGGMRVTCSCRWVNEQCVLFNSYAGTTGSMADGSDRRRFSCLKSSEGLGECINGIQFLTVDARVADVFPSSNPPTDDELETFGCVDEEKTISCGTPAALMPGFSFVNVMLVIIILGIFYFAFRRK